MTMREQILKLLADMPNVDWTAYRIARYLKVKASSASSLLKKMADRKQVYRYMRIGNQGHIYSLPTRDALANHTLRGYKLDPYIW